MFWRKKLGSPILEQTIESIYFLLLFYELRVCGELGVDATSCLEHDLCSQMV